MGPGRLSVLVHIDTPLPGPLGAAKMPIWAKSLIECIWILDQDPAAHIAQASLEELILLLNKDLSSIKQNLT